MYKYLNFYNKNIFIIAVFFINVSKSSKNNKNGPVIVLVRNYVENNSEFQYKSIENNTKESNNTEGKTKFNLDDNINKNNFIEKIFNYKISSFLIGFLCGYYKNELKRIIGLIPVYYIWMGDATVSNIKSFLIKIKIMRDAIKNAI